MMYAFVDVTLYLIVVGAPFFLQMHWLGSKYFLRGPEGNDIHKTNVPGLRIAFRHEVSDFCFLVDS